MGAPTMKTFFSRAGKAPCEQQKRTGTGSAPWRGTKRPPPAACPHPGDNQRVPEAARSPLQLGFGRCCLLVALFFFFFYSGEGRRHEMPARLKK